MPSCLKIGNVQKHSFVIEKPGARKVAPGRREHALHPGPRVRRAAHDLGLRRAAIDDADPQPVGVGMGFAGNHFADDEFLELCRPVVQFF